jgi:nitrogen regulatory protein PII
MKTNNHEVIFTIVNSGFAEEAMRVAREQGVRGGTILNARGVVNEDAAAFFGITLHADKEILMMVVDKDIRDKVLNALYKEMGLGRKSQGIVFSLPVSDVAGLAMPVDDKKEQE